MDDALFFSGPDEFEAWLEEHHDRSAGIWIRMAKKHTGVASLDWTRAVEVVLCFGWIDGRANRLDDSFYLQRVTPRRPRSVWSKKNVATVERLIAAGRMRPAGLAAVEAAQADGRWERAYAGPATIEVPDDLAHALAAEPRAQAEFDSLDGQNRYAVLWRVHTAGNPATRAKRIATLVQMLAEGRRLH